MSGNPFRRSLQQPAAINSTAATTFASLDARPPRAEEDTPRSLQDANPLSARTKKTVRITSPPHSPLQPFSPEAQNVPPQYLSRPSHPSSSPHTAPEFGSDSADEDSSNPFDRDTDGDEGVTEDEELTTNTRSNSSMSGPATGPSRAPPNPFQKTLATIESSNLYRTSETELLADRNAAEKKGPAATRGSMDVDAFKRLLMTGSAVPSPSAAMSAPTAKHSGIAAESSSSTDTSSVSRHSIFEHAQEQPQETPRSSYDTIDDNERANLVGEGRKSEKKKKPPPPKHRHGKLVSSRTPQTVSFSDFNASFSSPSPIQTNRSANSASLSRTSSDLNKPLPPPPLSASPEPMPEEEQKQSDTSAPVMTQNVTSLSLSDSPSPSTKRTPPPPPLARRHSQLRSSISQNRSRSSSIMTLSSQPEGPTQDIQPEEQLGSQPQSHPPAQTSATPKSRPPPPPTRRTGSRNTLTDLTSQVSPSIHRHSTVTSPTNVPSPPGSSTFPISAHTPAPPPGRTPSVRSTHSTRSARQHVTSPGSESSMPPPPPPPPRRGSSRTSLDLPRPSIFGVSGPPSTTTEGRESKRTSMDFAAGVRRTSSWSQGSLIGDTAFTAVSPSARSAILPETSTVPDGAVLAPDSEAAPGMAADDILADMSRLQQEVEELRSRYGKG